MLDRLFGVRGRVPDKISTDDIPIAAAALISSYCCFIVGAGYWWFAAGQFFLAMGIAMQSGTDTAFHYDSLKALGREAEYASREAKAEQWGLVMLAIATLS